MTLLRELLFTALLLSAGVDAFYGKHTDVVELDSKNFDKEILQNENAAMVEFYAPWCGHCQNLKPAYKKVAKSLKGITKVAAIDCDDERNKPTCGKYGIQGFPTLKIFKPSGKKGKPQIEDYQGPRTAKDIANALTEAIPNHVTRLQGKQLENFYKKNNESTKAILFTNKGITPAMWRSMAIDFLGAVDFFVVRDRVKEVVNAFGIDSFPQVVLLPGGDKEAVIHDGAMLRDDIFEFISGFKKPLEAAKPSAKASKTKISAKLSATEETKKAAKSATEKAKEKAEDATETAKESAEEPKPTKKVPVILPVITQNLELQATCLTKKAPTCVLVFIDPSDALSTGVVTEAYEKLLKKVPQTFQIYRIETSSSLGESLNSHLELEDKIPQLVALNYRGWFRRYHGEVKKSSNILSWLDAVRLGEGKKEIIPEKLLEENEAAMEEQKEKIIEAAKKMVEEMGGEKEAEDEAKAADQEVDEEKEEATEEAKEVKEENVKDEL